MERDVYAACPCGSGKKLKFCCHDLAAEMDKLDRLLENQQTRMALQLLEQLAGSHPQNPWVVTTYARILLSQGNVAKAKQLLEIFLQLNPEHHTALALYAFASFINDGLEQAKPAIHRAFQRCMRTCPDLLSRLAAGMAQAMYRSGKFLAARQHMVFAMRLAPQEMRSDVFLQLLEFDGETDIPYPLRSVQPLADIAAGEESGGEPVGKAAACAAYGCWGAAARLYRQAADQYPENAGLWRNAGLCAAWDGDESAAAEFLHRAARLHDDFETAVECETIAQLLDAMSPERSIRVLEIEFGVESVSRLLTALGEHDRIARVEQPERDSGDADQAPLPAGRFAILNRPVRGELAGDSDESDEFPEVLAELDLFDESSEHRIPSHALLSAREGEQLESARQILLQVAGELIEERKPEDEAEQVVGRVPRELGDLSWRYHFPPGIPLITQRKTDRRRWKNVVENVWPQTPLAALDGKTPGQAAGDPQLAIPLAAALFVLDAMCTSQSYSLELDALFERFQVRPPPTIEVADDLSFNSFSAMKLHRLSVSDLNDGQLLNVLNRALLIRLDRFLYQVLRELDRRPDTGDNATRLRAFSTLSRICRQECRYDEALEWVEKGKTLAGTQEKPFENVLQWTLLELSLRLEDPSAPGLGSLLEHIGSYYGRKLPEVLEVVRELVERQGVTVPWDANQVVAGSDAVAAKSPHSELWTPESGTQPTGDPKKLWIPGDR